MSQTDVPSIMQGYPIDHIGIAVTDLQAASRPYSMLGFPQLGPDEIIRSQHVRVRAFLAGSSLIELLEPTSADSPIARFLNKSGPGLHHVAFRTENLEAEIDRLEQAGARFISAEPRAGRAGTRVVFLHPKWGEGVLIELVEHA